MAILAIEVISVIFGTIKNSNSFKKVFSLLAISNPLRLPTDTFWGFRITDKYADNSAIFTRFISQTAIQDFDVAL